jgi:hypothetical protein
MTITARYASTCPICSARIVPGTQVEWRKGSPARHVSCTSAPVARRRMGSGRGHAAPVAGYSSYCTDNDSCRCYDCAS